MGIKSNGRIRHFNICLLVIFKNTMQVIPFSLGMFLLFNRFTLSTDSGTDWIQIGLKSSSRMRNCFPHRHATSVESELKVFNNIYGIIWRALASKVPENGFRRECETQRDIALISRSAVHARII